jgi:hypothetical protein
MGPALFEMPCSILFSCMVSVRDYTRIRAPMARFIIVQGTNERLVALHREIDLNADCRLMGPKERKTSFGSIICFLKLENPRDSQEGDYCERDCYSFLFDSIETSVFSASLSRRCFLISIRSYPSHPKMEMNSLPPVPIALIEDPTHCIIARNGAVGNL